MDEPNKPTRSEHPDPTAGAAGARLKARTGSALPTCHPEHPTNTEQSDHQRTTFTDSNEHALAREIERLEQLEVDDWERREREEARHAEWEFSSAARTVTPIAWWRS